MTSFRYKAGKAKPKKAVKAKEGAAPPKLAPPAAAKPNPKVAGLQKRLENARKKFDQAKAAGTPTRALEDKIYEIEDELRLTGQQ